MSNKINDTAWTVEEQYFNTTLSLADKGELHKDMVVICGCVVSYWRWLTGLQQCIDVKYSFIGCFNLYTECMSQYWRHNELCIVAP